MEAYQYLTGGQQPAPRLIVTDVMMPRLDGMQLVARLRAEPRLAAIPVIMLTAKGTPRDVIQGINSGVRHYITKPFKQDDLLSKVKKTLG
jgi:DNA-binding response OmpR family regulator